MSATYAYITSASDNPYEDMESGIFLMHGTEDALAAVHREIMSYVSEVDFAANGKRVVAAIAATESPEWLEENEDGVVEVASEPLYQYLAARKDVTWSSLSTDEELDDTLGVVKKTTLHFVFERTGGYGASGW